MFAYNMFTHRPVHTLACRACTSNMFNLQLPGGRATQPATDWGDSMALARD